MHIEENYPSAAWQLDSYEHGIITINGTAHTSPVLLTETEIIEHNWKLANLTAEFILETLSRYGNKPEILIIGTGEKQIFLHPKITAKLAQSNIGLETMSTTSACRTTTILQSEGRRIWAWLWP